MKPDYISLEEVPNSLKVRSKLEFVEQKTDYQAVYFSLKGIDGYFALKMRNEDKVNLGKEVELYIPYQRISIYDGEHNNANSRELVHENRSTAVVTNKNGKMQVKVAGATLEYPSEEGIADGEYDIVLKQDKLLTTYNKKMIKKNNLINPEMDNPKNKIKVSAYDEDLLGQTLLVYVQVQGFENYYSFVVKNEFSVYKMPKFEMYVPRDAFELIKK